MRVMQHDSTQINLVQKTYLYEAVLMRAVLALLIVVDHAFACYSGGWPSLYETRHWFALYKWIGHLSLAFSLEAFVFVAGYLFSFQRVALGRKDSFWMLFFKKMKRLIVPSIIFSLLYFYLFKDYQGLHSFLYSISRGCGHMWFLPMLFWCYLGGWLLEQIKINDALKMLFLIALTLFVQFYLPLRLDRAIVYIPFFMAGNICYKHRDAILGLITPNRLALIWVIFAIVFAILRPLRDVLEVSTLKRGCTLLYAGLGVIAFYATCLKYIDKHRLSAFTETVSKCSFGIYLIQQFVLKGLYYKTSFPTFTGPVLLPWCGFILAIVASFVLSIFLLRTKPGRLLIG